MGPNEVPTRRRVKCGRCWKDRVNQHELAENRLRVGAGQAYKST